VRKPTLRKTGYGVTLCLLATFLMAQAGCSSSGEDAASSQPATTPAVESPPAAPAESPQKPAPPAKQIAAGQPAPAAKTPPSVPAGQNPPAQPGQAADPFAVPEGTPEEILAYLETLSAQRPTTTDRETVMAFQRNICNSLVTAGERILAAKPTPDQAVQAVQAKFTGLSILSRMGDAEAAKARKAMPDALEKAGHADLAHMVRAGILHERLQTLHTAAPEEIDKLIGEVKAFIGTGLPQPEDAQLAMSTAQALEQSGNPQKAAQVYRELGKILAAAEEAPVARIGATMEGAARRMDLVGNKMPLAGATLAGEPLDWAKYKGKVVLVDFWATWCGPCLAELPNIRANYDLYHDHGFDVIGISVDQDRAALEGFLKENDLPWTVLFDHQAETAPEAEPMSQRYGIFGIPTVVLIGPDENVVALNVRGPRLGQELERLLGPPPEQKPAAKPAEKPTAKPAKKPAEKPAAKPQGDAAKKSAEKPAAKPVAKPAEKSAEKPAAKPAEKPKPQ